MTQPPKRSAIVAPTPPKIPRQNWRFSRSWRGDNPRMASGLGVREAWTSSKMVLTKFGPVSLISLDHRSFSGPRWISSSQRSCCSRTIRLFILTRRTLRGARLSRMLLTRSGRVSWESCPGVSASQSSCSTPPSKTARVLTPKSDSSWFKT